MISAISYILTLLSVIFIEVRTIICVCYSLGVDIGVTPINFTLEIVMIFVAIICMLFIIRRNIFGGILYFIAYGLYFGNDLYNGIQSMLNGGRFTFSIYLSLLGVVIATLTLFDILFNKERKGSTQDPKTDWFYKNKNYERKHDTRADENQYKF